MPIHFQDWDGRVVFIVDSETTMNVSNGQANLTEENAKASLKKYNKYDWQDDNGTTL